MKILWARHGQSEANVQMIISNRQLPHYLTEKGISQAQALAQRLKGSNMAEIYSSPIPRARQTAEIIAGALDLPITISPALREIDCGMMEGRGDQEAWQMHDALIRAWDDEKDYERRIPPDGESFEDVKARFLPLIDALAADHGPAGQSLLMITHGSLLSQMLALVLRNIDRRFTKQHGIPNCRVIETELTGDGLICRRWVDERC